MKDCFGKRNFSQKEVTIMDEYQADVQDPSAAKRRGRPRVANKKKQYTLTMRPDMYEQAREEADRRGISFSALIANALVEYLDK
jgi:predicted HicB family RNase H-like nuclease